MPFRFDPVSQKAVEEHPNPERRNDRASHDGPGSSQGGLLPPPGSSHSKIPAGQPAAQMTKSRHRTLGQKMDARELGPILQRAFIIIGLILIVLTIVIYAVSQQFKFNKDKSEGKGEGSEAVLTLPKGKKLSPLAMHQFLMKLAARAVDDGNYPAGARLYGRAAEEARLGPLGKQYIDALFAQGEVYQYNVGDSSRSLPIFEKVLKLQLADSTTKPIKLANTYNDLADSLAPDSEAVKTRIQTYYQKAITMAKAASDNKGHAYYSYNAGEYYFDQGQYDKALALGNESVAAFAKLKDADLVDIADSHYLAARSLAHLPGPTHVEQANSEYESALKTYEKAEADEDRYSNCMRDAAWNKLKMGQRSEAQELFDKASQHNADEDEGQNADTYMSDALK